MPTINFFSIPADDSDRARKFYEDVFGWKFSLGWEYEVPTGLEKYWDIATQGIAGGLTRREYPGQPIGVGVQVDDLEKYLGRFEVAGGKIIVPRTLIPNRAWFSLCQDTEGNSFVIYQNLKAHSL